MATYSNTEYDDILLMYGRADATRRDGKAAAGPRIYSEIFPQRRVPHVSSLFTNTYRRISETGNLHDTEPRPNNQQYRVTVDQQMLDAFGADPTLSTRKIAQQLNLSHRKCGLSFTR